MIGLSAGFAFQKRYRPDVYVTYVPLVVESSREARAKSLISNMDLMLASSAHARAIYSDFVANTDDEFRQLLQKLNWTEERFTALQTGLMGADRIPLRVVIKNEAFWLELGLEVPNLGQEMAAKFARSLRSSLLKINEEIVAKHVKNSSFDSVVQSSDFYMAMVEKRDSLMAAEWRKMYEIEGKLMKKMGPSNYVPGANGEFILRLVAYLRRDNKITEEEALAIQKETGKIYLNMQKIKLSFILLDDFEGTIRSMGLVDLEALLNLPQTAPIMNVDEAGLHTKYPIGPGVKAKVSKFILFLALGFAIGSLFGLFAYSFKLHLRHRAGLAG